MYQLVHICSARFDRNPCNLHTYSQIADYMRCGTQLAAKKEVERRRASYERCH
jgi:hypothetical protein